MNYLISTHNKYHSNKKRKNENDDINKNNISLSLPSNMMEIENNKNINSNNDNKDNCFEKEKIYCETEKKTNIGKYNNNYIYCQNDENINIFNTNKNAYFENCKNINFDNIVNKIKNMNDETFSHTFKKPSKRNYLDLLSGYKNDENDKENNINKNNKSNNTIINVNINNNNYYYINNRKYNISTEEKFGINFSKQKTLKKY